MSCFLKLSDQSLIMVDYNQRNGLYYQTFSKEQTSRPNLLLPNGTYEYITFLDQQDHFHVIAKNSRNQIVHFKESSNKISKDIVLDDHDNEFRIGNLYALSLNNQVHLFYYANHPTTKEPQLIHHLIQEPLATPKSVGNPANGNVNYDCIKYKNSIVLTMISKNEKDYNINISSSINDNLEWGEPITPVSSTFPITYCKLCIDKEEIYHLIYVKEQYGQYQLLYKNKDLEWSKEILLYSCGYPIKPVIFIYYDALWINWNENGTLKATLSVDKGTNFSRPIRTSMQDSNVGLHCYDSSEQVNTPIICNQLYGITYPAPKFAVLHSLDMDGIHSNMVPNTELKLYLSNIKDQLKLSVSKSELEEENLKLKNDILELNQVQTEITNQYNELADLAKKIQDEGKKWRELYNESKTEAEFYKKRTKQLEKSMESKKENKAPKTLNREEIKSILEKKEIPSSEE